MNGLTPSSVLLHHLRPESGAALAKWLAKDNARALKAKRRKQQQVVASPDAR